MEEIKKVQYPSPETKKKTSGALKGKKFTLEHRRKISLALKGKKKSPEHIKKMNPRGNLGKKFSKEHCEKISKALSGKPKTLEHRINQSMGRRKVDKFEGFTTSINLLVRGMPEYHSWHKNVLRNSKYICSFCKSRKNVEIHHKKPLSKLISENKIKTFDEARQCNALWDLNNGEALCFECHIKEDGHRKRFSRLPTKPRRKI